MNASKIILSNIILIAALLVTTLATTPKLQAQQAQTPTAPKLDIELFTKHPYTRQVEISPDGKHVAIIFKRDGEDMLGIIRLADMQAVQVVRALGKHNQIGRAFWANNERILYNILSHVSWDKEQFFNGDLIAVNINGKRHKAIMGPKAKRRSSSKFGLYGSHEVIDLMPNDKKHILVAFSPWREGIRYFHTNPDAEPIIYKVNIYNARVSRVKKLPMPQAIAITDNDHVVRLSVAVNDNNRLELHHSKDNKADWEPLALDGLPKAQRLSVLNFASKNKVYMRVDEGSGPDSLYLYDLLTHQAEKIYQHKSADISEIVYDYTKRNIVGLSTEADYPLYSFIDSANPMSKLHIDLLKKLNGYNLNITSHSKDSELVILDVYSDYDPGGYYLYNTKTGAIRALFNKRKWIDPNLMPSREPVQYTARDGLTLRGYLTRPLGKTQSLPTVILPHGGPHQIRDRWAFDWQSQLLANRGYAVLQLNFRGSPGYGYEFEKAGYGQWGAKIQDDLTDATKALIEQGIADKDRICIYGASFGGYASLMGVIREPDLYQCAIGSVGVYSLPMMFQEGDIADQKQGISYLKDVLGDSPEKLKAYSPAYNTDKIKVPLLLIHGERDNRAPIEHLVFLEQQLKANNKAYEKLILPKEGHGYYDEQTRIQVYSKIIQFLDQHIGK